MPDVPARTAGILFAVQCVLHEKLVLPGKHNQIYDRGVPRAVDLVRRSVLVDGNTLAWTTQRSSKVLKSHEDGHPAALLQSDRICKGWIRGCVAREVVGKNPHNTTDNLQLDDANHLVQRRVVRDQAAVHSEVRPADANYLKAATGR